MEKLCITSINLILFSFENYSLENEEIVKIIKKKLFKTETFTISFRRQFIAAV